MANGSPKFKPQERLSYSFQLPQAIEAINGDRIMALVCVSITVLRIYTYKRQRNVTSKRDKGSSKTKQSYQSASLCYPDLKLLGLFIIYQLNMKKVCFIWQIIMKF